MRRVFLSRKSDKSKLYTVIGMLLCLYLGLFLVLPKDNIIAAFRWANAGLKQISLDIRGYYKLTDPWIEDRVEIIR